MSKERTLKLLDQMKIRMGTTTEAIKNMIVDREFDDLKTSEYVSKQLIGVLHNPKIKSMQIASYMLPFKQIIKSVNVDGKKKWCGVWVDAYKEKNEPVFPKELVKSLGSRFDKDIEHLNIVWSKNIGSCSAFLIRRIVEKAIHLAFAKQGKEHLLKDTTKPRQYLGLDSMIVKAENEQGSKDNTYFLQPRTAEKLRKIKEIGDTAAHNFLADVYI